MEKTANRTVDYETLKTSTGIDQAFALLVQHRVIYITDLKFDYLNVLNHAVNIWSSREAKRRCF